MNREIITQAADLIKRGYSHHDKQMLEKLGVTDPEIFTAMERIFSHVILVRIYNMANAAVKHYEKVINPPMTLSEIRSYMYETSQLMLKDGARLASLISKEELEYAVSYTIFEVEESE